MKWTLQRLQKTLDKLTAYGAELPNIEVKKALDGHPENIAQTLCAFSNMPDGGTLICGIDEAQSFAPVGVYNINELEKSMSATLRNHLKPAGNADFTRLNLGGHEILIAEVAPLPITERPCYYKKKAYMRSSDGDYAMDDYEITRILASRERGNDDMTPVAGSTVNDLDSVYQQQFVQDARRTSQRLSSLDDTTVLKRKSVLAPQGEQLTVAGLYALGDYPQQFFPSLKVSGVVTGAVARNLDKLEADGPLPDLLEQSLAWLSRNLRAAVVDDGRGGLKNETEIPGIVLRELVANALVHRALDADTAHVKDIVIRILPDRVVMTNPGGLWAITTDRLAEPGHKTAVNPALYEICKLLQTSSGSRVIEGEGNGIYEAQRAMERAGLLPIEFVDRGFQFTAIIRRAPLAMNAGSVLPQVLDGPTHEIIYNHLLRSGLHTVQEIMEATGLSRRQVDYNLNKLRKQGKVTSEPVGGRKSRAYRVV
ncbi:RNA-binding domain-containing protein [Rothia nasimurium]|uniref:RNA-binding domain-containing protein n=1 Tax=Rothia nasimurium TaxID=85336 RepID=UPI002DD64D1E|nr:RNA-binding domain-containing protein [Rothia nasimurium]